MQRQPWWKGARGEWYVVAQFILIGLILAASVWLTPDRSWPAPWHGLATGAGLLLGAAGLALSLAGLAALGRNLTALPHPKDDAELVEAGAYRLVRHPIYSGLVLGALGWSLLLHSPPALLLSLGLLVLFDLKSRREERFLARRFPGYASYQRRVKKLIPFVY
jgi:protein-S-isoprenylcysteine O-methyltransferase Ste14